MDQFFEMRVLLFFPLLFLDVKTGGFDDAVYFACMKKILSQLNLKYLSLYIKTMFVTFVDYH